MNTLSSPFSRPIPKTVSSKYSTTYEAFSHPQIASPYISSCPRKRNGREDPYSSRWAQAQLRQQIKDRMWMDFQEMQNNPSYGREFAHINNCLMNTYCPKNPFQRKNLLGTGIAQDQNLVISMMDPHWTEKQRTSTYIGSSKFLNLSNTQKEYEELRRKMPKYEDKILSQDSLFERPSQKITFGEEDFRQMKEIREAKKSNRLNSQNSEGQQALESPKFETRRGLKNMVKRMSSSHEYEEVEGLSRYVKSIKYKDRVFEAIPLY